MPKPRSNLQTQVNATKASFAMLSPHFDFEIAGRGTLLSREIVMLLLSPSAQLSRTFDISAPIPAFYIPPQARTNGLARLVEKLIGVIPRSKPYDHDYIVIMAPAATVEEIKIELQDLLTVPRALIFFPYPISPGRSPKSVLVNHIYQAIGLRDLFGKTGHITNRQELFGRQKELSQITNAVQEGRNVGIFGLRKIGKTSLLLAVGANINDFDLGVMLRFDLDNPAIMRLRWWELLERIAGQIPRPYMHDSFAENNASRSFELTVGAWLRANPQKRLVVSFDEIEHITPGTCFHQEWANDYYHLFSSLRSISRQFENFSFIVCGINARSVEAAQLGSYENPIFNGVLPIYVPMFTVEQCRQMTHRLAKQLMLEFDDEAISALYAEFGGHPYLFRQACAHITKVAREKSDELPFRIDAALVRETQAAREQEMVGYCHYVLSHLNNFYEDELEMLAILSRGDVEQFKEYEAHFPSDTIHLRRYGLVELKEGAPRIRIPFLGKYFKSGSVRSLGVIKGAHEAGKKHIKRGNNPSADVFVFAALNEELEALIEQIGGQPKQWSPTPNSPYLFLEGEILMPGAYRPLRYVLGTPDEVGAAPAQNLMHHALKRFNPRYVLQAGISAGVRGVVELGDIVVADQVVDYSMGKRTVDGVQHHHQVWPSCKYLRSLAATMRMKGLTNGWWTTNMAERPDVHIGTVATGPFVLADGGTIGNLRKHWHKLLGVEMEAGGILSALHSSGIQHAYIMVKAVSDFGDQEKNDCKRKSACENSAKFVQALLKKCEAVIDE